MVVRLPWPVYSRLPLVIVVVTILGTSLLKIPSALLILFMVAPFYLPLSVSGTLFPMMSLLLHLRPSFTLLLVLISLLLNSLLVCRILLLFCCLDEGDPLD